jgi:hypothetical protein
MKKEAVITYLIDCKGYDEETANDIYRDWHEDLTQVFSMVKVEQMKEYSN